MSSISLNSFRSFVTDKTKVTTGITWNPARKAYIYPNGSVISDKTLALLLETHLNAASQEVQNIGQKLIDKKITLLEWQLQTRQALKELHLANALLARGGKKNMTGTDYLIVGRQLKIEYAYLRNFAKDINRGYTIDKNGIKHLMTTAQFKDRLSKYIMASEISYEKGVRSNYIELGYQYAERHLNSKIPCVDCPIYASYGVVNIEDLILPKQNCACGSRCKCTVTYYRTYPKGL